MWGTRGEEACVANVEYLSQLNQREAGFIPKSSTQTPPELAVISTKHTNPHHVHLHVNAYWLTIDCKATTAGERREKGNKNHKDTP